MYISKHNKNDDRSTIEEFIKQNGFGILISNTPDQLWATHLPLVLSEDGTKLSGHVSRANKQWRNFSDNIDVLAIFNGPHAYISSSWYDHENVPTWNYIAVHVYGKIKILKDEELYLSLKHMVDKYEKHSDNPVTIEGLTPEYLKKDMQGIVGFEIAIDSMEAAYKLSQNRDAKNHQAIIEQLEKREDHQSQAVAEAMKENAATLFKTKH